MERERRLNLQGRLEGREAFPDDVMEQLRVLVERCRERSREEPLGCWWALVVQRSRCLYFDLSGFSGAEDRKIAKQALATLLKDEETELVARGRAGLICFGPGFYQEGLEVLIDWADGPWAWFREPRELEGVTPATSGPYRLDLSWLSLQPPGGLESLHQLDTSDITNLETNLDPESTASFHIEGGLRALGADTPIAQLAALAWHQLERWWGSFVETQQVPQEALFGFMPDHEVVFPMPPDGAGLDALRSELAAQIVGFEGVASVAWVREEHGNLVVRTADQSGWAVVRRSLSDRSEPDGFEEGSGTPPWGDWWALTPNQGLLQSKLVFSQSRTWGSMTVGEA